MMENKKIFSVRIEADSLETLEKLTEQIAEKSYTEIDNGMLMKESRPGLYRRMLFGDSLSEIKTIAQQKNLRRMFTATQMIQAKVVFVFPGLGGQYANMGKNLYEQDGTFREEMDYVLQTLLKLTGQDMRSIIFPQDTALIKDIDLPINAQLANFVFAYSLGRTLIRRGIQPDEMIGYSFGEYVAACIAGVFNLEQALRLIVQRGLFIEQIQEGIMYSVPLTAEEVSSLLIPGTYMAIDNGESCVVAGKKQEMVLLREILATSRILTIPINIQRPLHTPLMEAAADHYLSILRKESFNTPDIPFIAGITGMYISNSEAIDPEYWIRHLTKTIQFKKGVETLISTSNKIFIEVGPGRGMTLLLTSFLRNTPGFRTLNLVRPGEQLINDYHFFLQRLLVLWIYGCDISFNE